MDATQIADELIRHPKLVIDLGRLFGRGLIQANLDAAAEHEREDDLVEHSPLEVAASRILDLIPAWAKEAARTPRDEDSAQHQLLEAAKRYLVALREAEDLDDA